MPRRTRRVVRGKFKPAGRLLPPGALMADPASPKPVITVLAYGDGPCVEKTLDSPEQIKEYLHKNPVSWVNVIGLGEVATIEAIGAIFGIHRLALEDVLNTQQRAKVDEYPDQQFVVAEVVVLGQTLEMKQISLFLGKDYLLSFEESKTPCFDPIRQRLTSGQGRLAERGPDFLLYAIVDGVLDSYFPVLEAYGERLDALEDTITVRPDRTSVTELHAAKRELLALRRAIWPHREAINGLVRDPSPLIGDEARVYLRDCYDHAVRIIDLVETYRELGSDLMDLYLSSVNNRMNEVMKTLTIFATIFMPLSFITGLYGMNFEIPELHWKHGYAYAWCVILATTTAVLFWIRSKGWNRSFEPPDDQAS